MNAFSNDEAVFNCTAVANIIDWRANGSILGNFMSDLESSFVATPASTVPGQNNPYLRVSTLTVSGPLLDVDGVNITCKAFITLTDPITSDTSEPVFINVASIRPPVNETSIVLTPISSSSITSNELVTISKYQVTQVSDVYVYSYIASYSIVHAGAII